MFYVYILECSDKTLYTGYTNCLYERVSKHNAGKGAKYTRCRRPCILVYYEEYATKSEALKREWEIKHKYTREDKLRLIKDGK